MVKKPANISPRTLADGQQGWYWRPNHKDIKRGCKMHPRSLGKDPIKAFAEARVLNAELKRWRRGEKVIGFAPGTVSWLLHGFLKNDEMVSSSQSLQNQYARLTRYITGLGIRGAGTFGNTQLESIKLKTVIGLHKKLMETHTTDIANRSIKMMRYAWDLQYQLYEDIIPSENIFSKFKKPKAARHTAKETVPVTYDELVSFISACIAAGEIGLAFGARCIWDMHIRPSEMFGTTKFKQWRPDVMPHAMWINVDKTDNSGYLPLDADGKPLMTELQSLYNMLPYSDGLICQRFQRGAWSEIKNYTKITVRIRERVGLGQHFTMAGVRHGGLTELGMSSDSGIQSRSMHKQRETLNRYVHATLDQQIETQRIREQHRREK